MNTSENLTMVAVFLTDGEISNREWNYYITQREGKYLYDFKLGDPVADEFGERCELLVEDTQTHSQEMYSFMKVDKQWMDISSKIKDLPDNQVISEAMSDAFDNIFNRYFREVESRPPPEKFNQKVNIEKEANHQAEAGQNGDQKKNKLLDHLDQDLIDEILQKAGDGLDQGQSVSDVIERGAIKQFERLRDVGQFLADQMKEKDEQIKDLQKSIEDNRKGFELELDAQKAVNEVALLQVQEEKKNVVSAKPKFLRKVFLEKVWSDLTLRLAFPTEEKEKAIYNYFEGLIDMWLPISLNNVEMEVVNEKREDEQEVKQEDEPDVEQEDEPDVEQEDEQEIKQLPLSSKVKDVEAEDGGDNNSQQEMDITQKNFYNDLQEHDVYPGQCKLLKELCGDDLELSEMVLGYVRKYGRDTIKNWWNEYQKYSSDIDF